MIAPRTDTTARTKVDYDTRKARFVIDAPPWLIAHCRNLPNRRWQSGAKVWTAPAIRANCDFIKRSAEAMRATFTRAAQDKIDEVLARTHERHQTGNFPTTYAFKTKPFAKQREALDALYGKRSMALFMEMGCGKTFVTVNIHAALCVDYHCDTVVLLCPLSIRNNWVRQLGLHMPDFVCYSMHLLNNGKAGMRAYDQWLKESVDRDQRWLVIGIESIAASRTALDLAEKFICSSTKSACIVDESHKIKNDSADRTRAAYRLARKAEWRTIMTGTPIANNPLDLYSQYEFLSPDIIGLGDFYSFRARYAIMGGYENREVLGFNHMDELTELLAPYTFQATKAEVLDLPPKLYERREVELTDEQRRLYNAMARDKVVVTDDKQLTAQNVLEKMLRLAEIVGGFVSYENEQPTDALGRKQKRSYREPVPGKNPKVAEMLEIAQASNQSTIVWCAYLDELHAVVAALKKAGHTCVALHGGLDETQRTAALDAFQANKIRFLVSNAATGGLGLDMTAGTLEVFFSNTFSYTDRIQAEDRAHRAGQTKRVTIVDLIAVDTVDQAIEAALRAKMDIADYIRQQINAAHDMGGLLGIP
jgi:SNF2 family DNA or RNA helicase